MSKLIIIGIVVVAILVLFLVKFPKTDTHIINDLRDKL